MTKHNVFISWSGARSKLIADTLYEWLPMVVQSVKPWMSSHSIDKGSRGVTSVTMRFHNLHILVERYQEAQQSFD